MFSFKYNSIIFHQLCIYVYYYSIINNCDRYLLGEIVKVESALSAQCVFCPIRLLLIEYDSESLAVDFDALAVDICISC